MGAIGRWGNSFDLDFWTAAACGEVDGPEMRAVDLLRHTTDEERFGYYCQTGMLPVMGNVTGRIYLLQRGGQAMELEDGRPVASWCISIGPHATEIPGTDHVVVLRNMVEGEELDFLEIGNRNPIHHVYDPILLFGMQRIEEWLPHAVLDSFGCDMGDAENEELLELREIRAEDWYDRRPGFGAVQPVPAAGIEYADLRERIQVQVQAELAHYDEPLYQGVHERAIDEGPEEPEDAAMEEIAVTEEEIDWGFADAHFFEEGELPMMAGAY